MKEPRTYGSVEIPCSATTEEQDRFAENGKYKNARRTTERRAHRMFTWKTLNGKKPRESSNSNYHYTQRCTMVRLQGNNLELAVLATGGGITQRRRPLPSPFSLSLSLGCSHFAPSSWKTENEQQHKLFALSHIYTYMTFGLFTNIASRALGKHIHKYVPASGSLSGYIHHPAP